MFTPTGAPIKHRSGSGIKLQRSNSSGCCSSKKQRAAKRNSSSTFSFTCCATNSNSSVPPLPPKSLHQNDCLHGSPATTCLDYPACSLAPPTNSNVPTCSLRPPTTGSSTEPQQRDFPPPSVEWPSCQIPESGDIYASYDQSYFLCNNVGVSLLELSVMENPQDDNQLNSVDCPNSNVVNSNVSNNCDSTSCTNPNVVVSANCCDNNSSGQQTEADRNNSKSTTNLDPSAADCCQPSFPSSHPSSPVSLFKSSTVYSCAILFWNVHSFLSGKHLLSSGHSIGSFSLF